VNKYCEGKSEKEPIKGVKEIRKPNV